MTIAATSMRIELTGIGPNALNNDADRDDDVWMPNDPTITMPAAAITRPRAERGARSLPNTPSPVTAIPTRPLRHQCQCSAKTRDVRSRLCMAGSAESGRLTPATEYGEKAGCRTITIRNSAPVYGFGQTRFTALNSRHALIAAMTTPTGIT